MTFLKWAGGKRQLLSELTARMPHKFGRYYEPFVGGGALFFHLASQGGLREHGVTLADKNELLIKTYRAVRDDLDVLLGWLGGHSTYYLEANEEERKRYFLSVRGSLGTPGNYGPDANEAARFIFLNKTCFNGLFRVNSRGEFNVPHGKYTNPTIIDQHILGMCSDMLQGVDTLHYDFAGVSSDAMAGDFIYFDPPYVPVNTTSSFTSYTRDGFTMDDQERLMKAARDLKRKGVHVMLSNADVPEVWKLYENGFKIERVLAKRSINSKADKRGLVGELIIT